jgi:flotillin
VWENGGANGRSNTADFLHKMAGSLPPMLQVMRDIGGVEIPTSLARLAGEDGAVADSKGSANGAERTATAEPEVKTPVAKPRA